MITMKIKHKHVSKTYNTTKHRHRIKPTELFSINPCDTDHNYSRFAIQVIDKALPALGVTWVSTIVIDGVAADRNWRVAIRANNTSYFVTVDRHTGIGKYVSYTTFRVLSTYMPSYWYGSNGSNTYYADVPILRNMLATMATRTSVITDGATNPDYGVLISSRYDDIATGLYMSSWTEGANTYHWLEYYSNYPTVTVTRTTGMPSPVTISESTGKGPTEVAQFTVSY